VTPLLYTTPYRNIPNRKENKKNNEADEIIEKQRRG
jgi:hypothetical protein